MLKLNKLCETEPLSKLHTIPTPEHVRGAPRRLRQLLGSAATAIVKSSQQFRLTAYFFYLHPTGRACC